MRYLAILWAGALAACAGTTPHWDSRFGVDTRQTLTRQITDPSASANTNPVVGMDARSGRAAYERYQKAAAEPQPAAMQGGAK